VSVCTAAAGIIAVDFCAVRIDKPLQTEVAQRLAVATQRFKETLFSCCCVHFKDGCAHCNCAEVTFLFYLPCIQVPFVIFVIGLSNYLHDSNSS